MFEEIDSVVFDWGGVLVGLQPRRCAAAFREIGFTEAEKMLSQYGPTDLFNRLEIGAIGTHEFCDAIRALAGCEPSDEAIVEALCCFVDEIPPSRLRAVKALRDTGVNTYALSNTNPIVTPYIVDVLFHADGLTARDYFVRMFLSYEMGLLKPDPAIFRRMIAQSGMTPARTLFIDDNARNVDAAHGLGFQVYMPAGDEDCTPLLIEIVNERMKHHE